MENWLRSCCDFDCRRDMGASYSYLLLSSSNNWTIRQNRLELLLSICLFFFRKKRKNSSWKAPAETFAQRLTCKRIDSYTRTHLLKVTSELWVLANFISMTVGKLLQSGNRMFKAIVTKGYDSIDNSTDTEKKTCTNSKAGRWMHYFAYKQDSGSNPKWETNLRMICLWSCPTEPQALIFC